MNTLILNAQNDREIETAAEIIKGGGLVALPTETVYGLGADALNEQAVENIFKAKGRPQDNPLIVHIGDISDLEKYGYTSDMAFELAEAFWPGPLTIIVKKRDIIGAVVSAGLDTVGIRMPSHEGMLSVIRRSGRPIAAPSANTSGKPSPTRAVHVLDDMRGKIEAVLDGGDCEIGLESTVVDTTGEKAVILRPGAITADMMAEVLGEDRVFRADRSSLKKGEAPRAPGMKYRHYAPKAKVIAVKGSPKSTFEYILKNASDRDGALIFSEFMNEGGDFVRYDFGHSCDKSAHGHILFSAFRELDKQGVERIFVQCPREYGEDIATMNRLKKSAGEQVIDLTEQRIIGITGPSGSGKSVIAKSISEGSILIDADRLYNEMLLGENDMTRELKKAFPEAFEGDKIDKKRLAERVFTDRESLAFLNSITHPHIVDKIMETARKHAPETVYIDAPTLFESGLYLCCTKIIAVESSFETCVKRIMQRDGITREQAEKRLKNQKNKEFFEKNSDEIILNL